MTPYSRTRTLVSALVLLSVAGCGAGTPDSAFNRQGDRSAAAVKSAKARQSDAGLSSALSRVGHTASSNGNYPTAVRMYRRRPGTLLIIGGLSLGIHVLLAYAIYMTAGA